MTTDWDSVKVGQRVEGREGDGECDLSTVTIYGIAFCMRDSTHTGQHVAHGPNYIVMETW